MSQQKVVDLSTAIRAPQSSKLSPSLAPVSIVAVVDDKRGSGAPTPTSSADTNRCVELALEGERRCRQGDPRAGVAFLEAALGAGTDDLRTLSAIYSQLGNAFFYMGDYAKALEYHRHDVTLARTIGDKAGEAKASGNLGNTLKVLGKHDEAVVCCQRHLEISRELKDKVGESRALYNLGNVYHAKGKHFGRLSNYEAGEYPQEVRTCLLKAVEFYERNLHLVQELNDRAAEGRSCGNLGNTFYLLGDFTQAVRYHLLRLSIAKQFGDKPAMRRAYSNLGNAHVFLGDFEQAIEYYKQALAIAIELGDSATEAQACYSLGNTATLLGEHEQAIEYHIRHLTIARQLNDKVGQARAAWSLGNAFMSLGQHSKSLYFVLLHMQLSGEICDLNGESIADQNLSDLGQILGINATPDSSVDPAPVEFNKSLINSRRSRRPSMDDSMQKSTARLVSPNISAFDPLAHAQDPRRNSALSVNTVNPLFGSLTEDIMDEESFFEFLSRAQSKRMDDQRCDPKAMLDNKENRPRVRATDTPRGSSLSREQGPEEFLDLVVGLQSRRMNDQRAELSQLPGLQHPDQVLLNQRLLLSGGAQRLTEGGGVAQDSALISLADALRICTPSTSAENVQQNGRVSSARTVGVRGAGRLDDDFIEMLIRCQSTRIDEQRSELPELPKAVTVPDDDFFQLVLKMQARRFEEQRANLVHAKETASLANETNAANQKSKKR